jgi:hypothetical protein
VSAIASTATVSATSAARAVRPGWLWLSLPITVLALAGSLAGILVGDIYAAETADWAGQALGQDIGNLLLYPLLLGLAYLAARGSLRAYLAWSGLLAYSAYTYAIYAFSIHFGPLFLLYVAVLGLSVYALIGSLTSIDAERVKSSFAAATPVRQTAWVINTLVLVFATLWLSADIPATVRNTPAEELRDSGLLTNPVHVLDLSLFLPAMALAGTFLLRRRALGFVLAPVVLVAGIGIAVGVVSLSVVLSHRGQSSIAVAVFMALLALVELIVLYRLLRHLDDDLAPALTETGKLSRSTTTPKWEEARR